MHLLAGAETLERIDRLMRGERIEADAETIQAGQVPSWYGDRTPADVAGLWLGWMGTAAGLDVAFYQAGAIGWASR
jgi:hypothetical protein